MRVLPDIGLYACNLTEGSDAMQFENWSTRFFSAMKHRPFHLRVAREKAHASVAIAICLIAGKTCAGTRITDYRNGFMRRGNAGPAWLIVVDNGLLESVPPDACQSSDLGMPQREIIVLSDRIE